MSENAIRIKSHTDLHAEGFDHTRVCYWWNASLGEWFIYLPKAGAGRLSQHKVTEHEDGTITVEPSILMHGHNDGTPNSRHGYLRRGVWEPCGDDHP